MKITIEASDLSSPITLNNVPTVYYDRIDVTIESPRDIALTLEQEIKELLEKKGYKIR